MKKFGIFIAVIAVVAIGIYAVVNTGHTVKVAWTEEDYNQAVEKTGISMDSIESVNLEALASGQYTTVGSKPAEVTLSSSEFTSLVAKANDAKGPIKETCIRFTGPDSGEVSFKLSEGFKSFLKGHGLMSSMPSGIYVKNIATIMPMAGGLTEQLVNYVIGFVGNSPVYANGTLKKVSANTVELHISTLKVGQINMNAEIISRTEYEVTRILNAVIAPEHGFSIEELRIENGQIYYKGTMPEEIKGVSM